MTISQFGYIAAAGVGVAAAYYWPRITTKVSAYFAAKKAAAKAEVVKIEAEVKAKI